MWDIKVRMNETTKCAEEEKQREEISHCLVPSSFKFPSREKVNKDRPALLKIMYLRSYSEEKVESRGHLFPGLHHTAPNHDSVSPKRLRTGGMKLLRLLLSCVPKRSVSKQ